MQQSTDQTSTASNISGSGATSTPSLPPTQSVSPAPHKRSKLIYLFVALLILLVLTTAASIWANLYRGSEIKVTTSPTPSPTPTSNPTASWKTVTTSFANLQVPNDWDMWDCGNGTFVIMVNNPQGSAHECPFDGQQLLYLTLQTTPYENLDNAAAQPENDPNSVDIITISDVTRTIVDGKDAAIWKTTIAPKPGQESTPGTGTFISAAIMPNIRIQGAYSEKETIQKVLSTLKFTK